MVAESKKRKRKIQNPSTELQLPEKVTKQAAEEEKDVDDNVAVAAAAEEILEISDEQMDVEETDGAVDELPPEERLWFSKDFKMLEFRTKLRGNDFITEMRHFLYLASTRPQLVAKYIEKHGKPLELVEALERVDKTNLYHISYICHALQLVLMEILTNHKDMNECAVSAVGYFLKSHSGVIEKLLKSPNLSHRQCILKLLTALVCVEPQVGRQLLTSFDILSNLKTLEELLSHSKQDINEPESVRKAYIHFILAYMIDGNIVLIRHILDKSHLIRALISGLSFDDHVTVCVVLSTLKKYVLEDINISKTKKVNVFDVECVKNLIRLYNWQGPKAYAASLDKKIHADEPEAEEKKAVAEAIHEFLVILLSSRKFGITFDSMTNFRQKHNVVQSKVIAFIDKPWFDPLKAELIFKILKACPELARQNVRAFAELLNPFKTGKRYWVPVAEFVEKLIAHLHPSIMRSALDKITITDYTSWIKDICLSAPMLFHLTGKHSLKNKDYQTRRATVRLLLTMYQQYCNYMKAIVEREKYKGSDMRRFKFDILDHILVNFPTIELIIMSLYMSIQEQTDPEVDVLEHLDITLDLILLICHQNRNFVNKTGSIIDYLEVLRPLYATADDQEGVNTNVKLEMKAIKTILLLVPNALKLNKSLFTNVVKSFVQAFLHGEEQVQRDACSLLRGIFYNAGLFENSRLEIDLWLEALRFVDSNTVVAVSAVLPEILMMSNKAVKMPTAVESTSNVKNLSKLFETIENGFSVQGYIETISISKLLPLMLAEAENTKELVSYLEIVSLLMFHYVPNPKTVELIYVGEAKFTESSKYMNSWSGRQKPASFNVVNIPFYSEVFNALVQGESSFFDVFKPIGSDSFAFTLNGKEVLLNSVLLSENMIVIYAELAVFVATHLAQFNTFTEKQSKACSNYLCNCMKILQFLKSKHTESNQYSSISTEDGEKSYSHLEQLLKYIFCNQTSLMFNFQLFNEADWSRNFLNFIHEVTECANSLELATFNEYNAHYRMKIVKEIEAAATSTDNECSLEGTLAIVEIFRLSADECVSILEVLCKLPYDVISQKSIFFEILILALNRLAEQKQSVNAEKFIQQLGTLYSDLVSKSDIESYFEKFETALYSFLIISHHCIPSLSADLFTNIFDHKRISKATVKLATLLLERNNALDAIFLANLTKHLSKKELIYPLLNTAVAKGLTIETTVLSAIYQEYKNGFMKTIEKPQKAGVIYKENVDTSVYLIDACMPVSECVDFCKKNLKFDFVEIFQAKVIDAIFRKAINSIEDEEAFHTIFVQYLNLAVQMFTIVLKREVTDSLKISSLAFLTFDWIQQYRPANADFEKILKSANWMNFCKTSLKLGIQKTDVRSDDSNFALILKLLAYLCNIFYADVSEHPEPGQFYEMIFSHSKFLDIALGQQVTEVKTEIVHLLVVFAQKNKSVLNDKHIPILLGAYQAKLNACDRYILALIQLYETSEVSLHQFRPFIWGESAISFYSLRDGEEKVNLQQQETSVDFVMSLIDRYTAEYTLKNFPIWRKLNALQQLPEVGFDNPDSVHLRFGKNSLERSIESGKAEFEEAVLRLCPKKDALFDECYDPAFLIPLMTMCFAPEVYSQPVRPVQNGLLAVVFAALSSQDKHMRLAAGCTQLRYRQHFENAKFFDKPVWSQAYDNIQSGLETLRKDWLRHKHHGVPRVPYISCLFLAKTMNLTIDPCSPLYKSLTMYLRLKESFNFQCVPEFNVLFHSHEIEHHSFRKFIVEVIRDGLKCSSDLFLLVSTSTFKALMGFYNSTMSTLDVNLLILSILSTCVKIPASSKIMVEHVGIIPWLSSVISSVQYFHFDTIEGLINIVSNLWYAIKANEKNFHNFKHIQSDIYRLLVKLLPSLSSRISVGNFAKLLNILTKTASGQHKSVGSADLDKVIGCAQKHFEEHIWLIKNIKENGASGAESMDAFGKNLKYSTLEADAMVALYHLREFVLEWVR